jgi:hypothetical protein
MLYLHIGVGKAGSTTIQSFLSLNYSKLRPYVGQLNSFGIGDSWKIAAASETELAYNYWVKKHKKFTAGQYREFIGEFWHSVESELNSATSRNFVASSEYIFSQYAFFSEDIHYLRDRLVSLFGNVKIIFYCRPQLSWAKSFYGQIIKGPSRGVISYDQFVDEFTDHEYHWNYFKGLSFWAQAFGDENIIVRVFDKENFVNGSLVDDFLSLVLGAGAPAVSELCMPAESQNVSPKSRRIELLRKCNKLERIPLVRGSIARILRRVIMSNAMKFIDYRSQPHSINRDRDILLKIDAGNRAFNRRFVGKGQVGLPTVKDMRH